MTDPGTRHPHTVTTPHPPLDRYYRDETQRRGWVRRMFDNTASDYDRIERLIGFGSGSRYRRDALVRAGLKAGMRALDVGAGTGLVTRQAAAIVGDPALIIGVDPSPGMLECARVPAGVKMVEGSAEHIPFPDASFDFVSMGYALRHLSDLSVAFPECLRVLKPGGQLCILEITRPQRKFVAAMLKAYLRGIVPLVARVSARNDDTPALWAYYWDTIEQCVPPEAVMQALEGAGFRNVRRHVELQMFSEYCAERPAA
jgi:demethylmenaquinone methyltransferase / 2-methoxy-6-polyprenyl-1,4-benzoquinol methylase